MIKIRIKKQLNEMVMPLPMKQIDDVFEQLIVQAIEKLDEYLMMGGKFNYKKPISQKRIKLKNIKGEEMDYTISLFPYDKEYDGVHSEKNKKIQIYISNDLYQAKSARNMFNLLKNQKKLNHIKKTLIHEITHAMQVRDQANYKTAKKHGFEKYVNQPKELQAFISEIVYEITRQINEIYETNNIKEFERKLNKILKGAAKSKFPTSEYLNDFWDKQKKVILKTIYKTIMNYKLELDKSFEEHKISLKEIPQIVLKTFGDANYSQGRLTKKNEYDFVGNASIKISTDKKFIELDKRSALKNKQFWSGQISIEAPEFLLDEIEEKLEDFRTFKTKRKENNLRIINVSFFRQELEQWANIFTIADQVLQKHDNEIYNHLEL